MKNRKKIYRQLLMLAAFTIAFVAVSGVATAQEISLQKAVVSSGGGTASNGTTSLHYTVAQPVVGTASNGAQTATFGFWNETLQLSSVNEASGAGSVLGLTITPNPIVESGEIHLRLARGGNVEVLLYNSTGQLQEKLFSGTRESGELVLSIDGENLASGTYFVAVRVPGAIVQRTISVVK